MSESIKTIWRLGYIRLIDNAGYYESPKSVSLHDSEWVRIIWRIYWRVWYDKTANR